MNLLIVVDMQHAFVDGKLGTPEAEAIVPKVAQFIREWNGEILYTEDVHDEIRYKATAEARRYPIHCVTADEFSLVGAVFPEKPAEIIWKDTFAPCQNWCEIYNKYDSYTIIGLITDACVISTALMLRSMHPTKTVMVIADCCAGSTPELHQKALDVMESCCIDVIKVGMDDERRKQQGLL